jgi:broad specificity phosphatase PhoE
MKTLAIVTAAMLSATAASAQTVILVRHAEKAATPANDPDISAAGQARAQDLKTRLAGAGVTLVIHSEARRTKQTAKPTADAAHAPMKQIAAGVADPVTPVVAAIKAAGTKATVLVVGHSNTIPAIARKLGDPAPPDIADNVYDTMIVIQLGKPKSKVIHARYGAPTP